MCPSWEKSIGRLLIGATLLLTACVSEQPDTDSNHHGADRPAATNNQPTNNDESNTTDPSDALMPGVVPEVLLPGSGHCLDDDGDGLCNDFERLIGTDPFNPDTDGDGFWDGWEYLAGTDPLDPTVHPEYYLPEGQPYATRITRFSEPQSIANLATPQLSRVPPLLLYIDNLSNGSEGVDVLLAGGVGERTSFGDDEVPDTMDDVYAMHYGSISQLNGKYHVRLEGVVRDRQLEAHAETIVLDLGSFSSSVQGVRLRVDEVMITGELSEDLKHLHDIVLKGILSDQGVDDLLDAVRDYLPLSKEQALRLLDPQNTGTIEVELGLDGHQAIVEGFTAPQRSVDAEPREPGECCPQGAVLGDSIYPFLTWQDQGIQDYERDLFQLALQGLQQDSGVALVLTAMKDALSNELHYHVYSGGAVQPGSVVFRRLAGDDGIGQIYETLSQSGHNPLSNVDPKALGTLEAFLDRGSNPNDVSYLDKGYSIGDPRLQFVPVEQMHYPFAYERIAQIFDDPRAGDFFVLPASYAKGGFGTHGHLGSLQSRSPLLISGPGIRTALSEDSTATESTVQLMNSGESALIIEDVAKIVDIAPTIAAALGVEHTVGVGPDGRIRDDVYLKWQDGRVLREVFTDEAWEKIQHGEPVAERAIIIVNDGLTNIELLFQALSSSSEFEVDAYQHMMARGLAYRYGSITNFPSNTYPSHNSLGAGAWAGHHGVVDNSFWDRGLGVRFSPISEIFETEHFLGSAHTNLPVETLHEAVHRSFGDLEATGTLTASINEPSSRGATLATLEKRFPEGFSLSDDADTITIGNQEYELPMADLTDYGGIMDNASLATLVQLFLHHQEHDDGLPIPQYTIVNFGSTDVAGHAHGPHGDQERYVVISRVNQRMNTLFALLEYLEISDSTLIVLTSDHGMELQDYSRVSNPTGTLNTAGVRYRKVGQAVYFSQLQAEVVDQSPGDDGQVTIRLFVYDRDTRWGPELLGARSVLVQTVNGGTSAPVATDDQGYVTVDVSPTDGAPDVLLELTSPDWTTHRIRVDLD